MGRTLSQSMKILLIYPYFLAKRIHEEEITVVPIGLYYVGAMLKANGYYVKILNWSRADRSMALVEKTLTEERPDLIGFSVFHANRWGAIDLARKAKSLLPHVRTVFGGIGATFLWEHVLTHFPQVDYVVLGEGEKSFLALVRAIERKEPGGLDDIPGIAYRVNGKPHLTASPVLTDDLDQLPDPALYFMFQHVVSTRGCPGNCTFCGSPLFWGRKVRFHSADYVVDQLERLNQRGVRFFYFSDDTFTARKAHVVSICKKILERGLNITWVAISRVNHVDPEILCWMRKAGCIQISYGVESGSERIRRLFNKNIQRKDIQRAFRLTTSYGILSRAYFIYGSPGEDWDTIQETVDLMDEIKPLSAIFYVLDLFPGTALYSMLKGRGSLSDDIWLERIEDILYFETDPRLSAEMVLAFGKRLRETFHENLPRYVDAIDLVDREDLFPLQADFLSRLGMTFSQGDYANVPSIKKKDQVAGRLFLKALKYGPDDRAYLGLGMVRQKNRDFLASAHILEKGIQHFPESETLHLCLAITYMNLGRYRDALPHLLKFPNSREATSHLETCRQALRGKKPSS
jgi:anaerobic magnesium-protoporphyrin IX monomethyl ester cyclase